MAQSVGIYLKDGAVQVAALRGPRRSPRLALIGEVRAGKDAAGELSAFFEKNKLPKTGVNVTIETPRAVVRKVVLPLTNVAQIRRTIKFQAEKYLPGVSPEDAAVDFFVTKRTADGTELVMVIVPRRELEADLEVLRAAGIEPGSVSVDFVSIFNVLSAGGAFKGKARAAAVDFSGAAMKFFLVEDGSCVLVRNVPSTAGGLLGGSGDLVRRIVREVNYSATIAGWTEPPEVLVLSGSVPAGLSADALERELKCEAKVFNPASALTIPDRKDESGLRRMLAAPGAALKGMGRESVAIDLLRKEYVYRGPYETIRRPLILAAVLLVVFLAAELFATMERTAEAEAFHKSQKRDAKKLFRAVFPGKKPKFASTFHKMIKNKAVSGRAAAGSGGEGWPSFLDFMRVLSESLPEDKRTNIRTIRFNGKVASIIGDSDDHEAFEKLATALDESGHFEVRTSYRTTGKRDRKRVVFPIELTPKGY